MGGGGGWAEVRVIGLVHLHVPWTTIFLCRFLSSSSSSSSLLFQSKCPAAGTQQSSRDKDTYIPSSRLLWPFAFFSLFIHLSLSFFKSRALLFVRHYPRQFSRHLQHHFQPPKELTFLYVSLKKTKKKTCCEIERAQVATFRHVDSAVKGTRSDKLFTNINCVIGCWRLGEWNW